MVPSQKNLTRRSALGALAATALFAAPAFVPARVLMPLKGLVLTSYTLFLDKIEDGEWKGRYLTEEFLAVNQDDAIEQASDFLVSRSITGFTCGGLVPTRFARFA